MNKTFTIKGSDYIFEAKEEFGWNAFDTSVVQWNKTGVRIDGRKGKSRVVAKAVPLINKRISIVHVGALALEPNFIKADWIMASDDNGNELRFDGTGFVPAGDLGGWEFDLIEFSRFGRNLADTGWVSQRNSQYILGDPDVMSSKQVNVGSTAHFDMGAFDRFLVQADIGPNLITVCVFAHGLRYGDGVFRTHLLALKDFHGSVPLYGNLKIGCHQVQPPIFKRVADRGPLMMDIESVTITNL